MNAPVKPAPLVDTTEQPPHGTLGILARLGPGLIIAGSIVGSGELIATTKTGAEAGFWLLWLIIIGCLIKVFVQVELGRDVIARGKSTMDALSEVPGPRVAGRGNWLVWYWFIMFVSMCAQLGGIAGSVGQALAITWPLTAQGEQFNQYVDVETNLRVATAELDRARRPGAADSERIAALEANVQRLTDRQAELGEKPAPGSDVLWWTTLLALVTSVLLVLGRYSLIQNVTTAMVAVFTLVTVLNVIMLQTTASWAITWSDIWNGLSFRLPPGGGEGGASSLPTALKTFGIIGVGASELVAYPYWCLEKGYARFTGPAEPSAAWADRARGWLRVLRWDAWCSMVVYTTATLAFYLLGAAILGRTGMNPSGNDLIRTLGAMYEPVFGSAAEILFLIGAFAVLYSTFFVANAGNARIFADAVRVIGFAAHSPEALRRRVVFFSGLFPLFSLLIFWIFPNTPDQLVLFSGLMQALMLPMLSAAALYFRYTRCDPRVRPGRLWDACLWISSLGMLLAAGCLVYVELAARFFK